MEPCLLTLDLKAFIYYIKAKHTTGKEFHNLAVQGKELLTQKSYIKIMQPIRITSGPAKKNDKVKPVQPVQINIYQSNSYRKDLNWLDFDDKPKARETQQVKEQHAQRDTISSFLMKQSF